MIIISSEISSYKTLYICEFLVSGKLPKIVNMDEVNIDELPLADPKEEFPPPIPPRCS